MPYHLRFFFEYGVDTPLWPGPPGDPDLDSPYGYPCAPEKLPITPATRNELTRLADLYQSSLDWDHPAGPSPWTRDQQESFRSEAGIALEALRHELGDDWTVEDRRG
ncbi:hypothetical protein ACFU7Y_04260 [Kitasatospora sp. NPDC057542]|uniref:hypothetical protein n=1 Tax=Streptomycetaceae TaxID=2062 RepID=UPI001CCFE348|nr:hypothetical protein [Streptomyces sp. LS1784]